MAPLGRYVKMRFPRTYRVAVDFINQLISASRPYSIYITDGLGGSFKNYMHSNNMPAKIDALVKNFDAASAELVQIILQRLLYYPDQKYSRRISKYAPVIGGLLPVETVPQQKLIAQELQRQAGAVKLPRGMIEESVFYFYHGLSLLPKEVHEYIKGQHFMDLGAYIGDSAIALNRYGYSKIFSLEISVKSIDRYRFNMIKNNIPTEKYKILNMGVASSDHEPPLKMFDTGSAGFSLYRTAGKYDEIQIERRSLDSI